MVAGRKRSFVSRLFRAAWAFFRALGVSLYAGTRYRLVQLTFFRLALRVVVLVVGISVIEEICNNNPVLDVVNVPKEFQDEGYTPDVVARMINDQMRKIDAEAKVLERQPLFVELATDSPLPDLQLPGAGVSLKSAMLFVREVLRFPPERIIVDLTLDIPATGDGKPPSSEPQLRVIVRRVGGASPTLDQIPATDPDTTFFRLAQDVMTEADPYVLGVYLVDKNASERSRRCFQKATELNPRDALAFSAWGYVLQRQSKFADAIAKFQKAAQLSSKETVSYKSAVAYNNWRNV